MGEVLRNLARSPLVVGLARGLDLFGEFNEPGPYRGKNPVLADARAMASDWAAVGEDVWTAAEQAGDEDEGTPAPA